MPDIVIRRYFYHDDGAIVGMLNMARSLFTLPGTRRAGSDAMLLATGARAYR